MDKRQMPAAAGQTIRNVIRRVGEKVHSGDPAFLHKILFPAGIFAAGLLLGSTEMMVGVYPFGAALLCAVTGWIGVACAYAGTVLGTLGISAGGLWHVLILTVVLAARTAVGILTSHSRWDGKDKMAFLQKLFYEDSKVRIGIAVGAAIAAGCISIFSGLSLYYDIFSAVLGVVLYPLFCAAFQSAFHRTASRERKLAGMCGVFFALTLALDAVALPFSIGILFSYFLTLYVTYAGGITYGIVWGLFCGIALDALYAPMYPIAALCAGLLYQMSPGGAVLISGMLSMSWAVSVGGFAAITDVAPELALICAVMAPLLTFRILPAKLPAFLMPAQERSDVDVIVQTNKSQRRYARICRSLESLSKLLFSVSDKLRCPSAQEAYQICTAVRARYCCGCPHEAICGGQEEAQVSSFFDNMAHRLSTHGRVSAQIVPEALARRCHHMDAVLDAVNMSARRTANMSTASQRTELFASDYAVIAEMLRETGEADTQWERDEKIEEGLRRALQRQGFSYTDTSVYGQRQRHVYMRGIDLSTGAGAEDIRLCAESILGARLSPPEFSLDGAYVSAAMHSVPMFGIKSGRYSSAGIRDETSGDSVCSFKNNEGYYYTLVSDGMGSGKDAALTSGISAVFLEKLLVAGCPMKGALEMLNCFIRGSEGECFTTVDLMEADLLTGRARFIKSGAAPSFVIRGGQLFRLHSKTVPVGIIRALDAEAISFDLQDGDTVIMMSDGVTGNYEDCPWLYELLCSGLMQMDSPAAAARLIGERAAQAMGREDDITVCVMQVEEV